MNKNSKNRSPFRINCSENNRIGFQIKRAAFDRRVEQVRFENAPAFVI